MTLSKPLESEVVVLHFDTDAHSVDLSAVTEFLSGFARAASEATGRMFPGSALQIRVRPFERGSLDIPLLLMMATTVTPTLWGHIAHVREVIGMVKEFFEVWKALGGEQPTESRDVDDSRVEMKGNSGQMITTPRVARDMYVQNVVVHNHFPHLAQGFDQISRDNSVRGFALRDAAGKSLVEVDRETFKDFAAPRALVMQISSSERKKLEAASLRIVKPVLEGRASWEFIWNGRRITAKMEDPGFADRVDAGERFAQGDVLDARLEAVQQYEEKYAAWVDKRWSVVEVVRHQLRDEVDPHQGILFEPEPK